MDRTGQVIRLCSERFPRKHLELFDQDFCSLEFSVVFLTLPPVFQQCVYRILTYTNLLFVFVFCYVNRKAVSQTVLQVRRWIQSSASKPRSSPSSSSSLSLLSSNIIALTQSPRRLPRPPFSDASSRLQQLRSSRRAMSGLLKSPSLMTTDYGWLDAAGPAPHPTVSRSLSDLRPQSSDLQSAPDHIGFLHSGQVREALEPIQEASELDAGTRKLRRPRDTAMLKSDELNKENVRPPGRTTTSKWNKSSKVAHQTSQLLNASMRVTEDGSDRLELGDVTSELSSCRRALLPTNCTIAADDDADVDADVRKRTVHKPAEFQRGLTRRSFSLPRIKTKFSLKVGCGLMYRT